MSQKPDNHEAESIEEREGDRGASRDARRAGVLDPELEEYRNLVAPPTSFGEGFTWVSVAGAAFCGLLMFPGAIYLGLLSGMGMSAAATWVTLIVFSEITRRALRAMSKEEMVILLGVAGAMIGGNALMPGGPFGQLIWRQYLVGSDAVRDAGLYGDFPSWFAPSPESVAITGRSFLHSGWAMPIFFLLFATVIGFVQQYTLGYAIFRLTSDVEKLPFPMAPVGAMGVTALVEGEGEVRGWRWTTFTVGSVLGLAFGAISVGLPVVSSAFLERPLVLVPIPWFDLTLTTESILPATPTGVIVDIGLILVGFVIPFWAVVGSALSVILTFVLNPILYYAGVLKSWHPGMDTVNTQIANSMDFYFSVGIGVSLGVAFVSFYQTGRRFWQLWREGREKRLLGDGVVVVDADEDPPAPNRARLDGGGAIWETPPGRGDWSLMLCFWAYLVTAILLIAVCKWLVPGFSVLFLAFFALVYTPVVSYLNARIMGIAGQYVELPFVREAFILLSGVKGVSVWLAPIPIDNQGYMAQQLRTTELTGTKFTSQIKAALMTTPLLFILSFVFWSFIWRDGPIPSDLFPYAQKMWDLQARSTMILWTSTTGDGSQTTLFDRSFHPEFIGAGFGFSVVVFAALSLLGLPTMLVYGLARGLGTLPHGLILELFGAVIARYYLRKKIGNVRFMQAAPILLAGYFVGTGLVGMAGVAIKLVSSAISLSPF